MNRTLNVLFLAAFLLAAAGSAEAKVTSRSKAINHVTVPVPKTVIIHMDQLPTWVRNEGERMLHSRHRTAVINDMLYVGDYPDTGDVVRLTSTAIDTAKWFADVDVLCGQGVMPIGTSSPRHYDPRRSQQIMSDFYNAVLGPPRANTLASSTSRLDEPYNGTVRNFRPGVLLVFYEFPQVVTSRPAAPASPPSEVSKFWVRPSVGLAGAWLDKQRVTTPSIGIVAGTHFGKYVVGAYAVEGQDFQPENRGTTAYGVQFGREMKASIRLGYRSTWTEIRGDGHTTARAEGVEAGIGYGFPVCHIGLGVAVLQYADTNDRGGEYLPAITLNFDLGPLFQAK